MNQCKKLLKPNVFLKEIVFHMLSTKKMCKHLKIELEHEITLYFHKVRKLKFGRQNFKTKKLTLFTFSTVMFQMKLSTALLCLRPFRFSFSPNLGRSS